MCQFCGGCNENLIKNLTQSIKLSKNHKKLINFFINKLQLRKYSYETHAFK
jgi:hypothetical protein